MKGRKLCTTIDEQIVFSQLEYSESAVWSLFLASGYLKADSYRFNEEFGIEEYELSLTNKEVRITFEKMIRDWFGKSVKEYNGFIKALLRGNTKEMNAYMNRIARVLSAILIQGTARQDQSRNVFTTDLY